MIKPLLILLVFSIFACNSPIGNEKIIETSDSAAEPEHEILGEDHARRQLGEILNDKGETFTWDTLIKTPSTAIAIAEPILFDVFGKEQILSQKPYEAYHINGYWYLSGTIPKGGKGGGFEIIFSARDAKIIRLTHYK